MKEMRRNPGRCFGSGRIDVTEAAGGATDDIAVGLDRTGSTFLAAFRLISVSTKGAGYEGFFHIPHPTANSNCFRSPPTMKASGNTTAEMASEVRHPLDLPIMKTLAMQGINSVMVTMETTT